MAEKERKSLSLASFNEKVQALLSRVFQRKEYEEINVDHNLVKDQAYQAPHLHVGHGAVRPVVLTVGDPFRVDEVAEQCSKSKEVQWNREYRLFDVEFEGV